MQALERWDSRMDPLPLEQLFEDYSDLVVKSAYRITGNLDDAEDVLQTVFSRLVKSNRIGNLGEAAKSYLQRAAINAALDIVRSKSTSRSVSLEDVEFVLPGRPDQRPDRLSSAAEIRKWLREAIAQLNPRASEVFVLKFLEGFSNQEIADVLGTSPGTVSVTLHRTRSQLRQTIQSAFGEAS